MSAAPHTELVAETARADRADMGQDNFYYPPDTTPDAHRRRSVLWAKRLLPLGALLLLGSIALWPQLDRDADQERVTLHQLSTPAAGGAHIVAPRYRSVDDRSRPFTITADSGHQVGPDRVKLTQPKGDISLNNGNWVIMQARQGVFSQRDNVLDLSDDAQLYQSDGTTLATDSATVDTRAGVVSSNNRTHAEGPFGTLDSQGFTVLDRGAIIQFHGPSRLVMNSGASNGAGPAATPDGGPPPPPNLSRRGSGHS